MHVEHAIRSRFSVRAFLPTPVPRETVRQILDAASWAPSGSNIQPWQVWVVAGAVRDRLVEDTLARRDAEKGRHVSETKYYPEPFPEPFLGRRRATGWGLYAALGIKKGESERMWAQHGRNQRFFDAPVGLIFTIDKRLEIGSWLDYGTFLQNVMLAARGHGLHTCPQVAWTPYHQILRRHLAIPADHTIVCGMALGYADPDVPEYRFRPKREPVETWTTFLGFGEDGG